MELIIDFIFEIMDNLLAKFVMDNSKIKPWVKIAVAVGLLCVPLAGCGFIMYIGLNRGDWLSILLGLGLLLTFVAIFLWILTKRTKEHRGK